LSRGEKSFPEQIRAKPKGEILMMTSNAFQNIMALTNTMNMVNSEGRVRMSVNPILSETGMVKYVRVVVENPSNIDYLTFGEEELNQNWESLSSSIRNLIASVEQN